MSDFSEIKNKREEIISKWKDAGFLGGITRMADEKITELFQCCAKSKIKELNPLKKDN